MFDHGGQLYQSRTASNKEQILASTHLNYSKQDSYSYDTQQNCYTNKFLNEERDSHAHKENSNPNVVDNVKHKHKSLSILNHQHNKLDQLCKLQKSVIDLPYVKLNINDTRIGRNLVNKRPIKNFHDSQSYFKNQQDFPQKINLLLEYESTQAAILMPMNLGKKNKSFNMNPTRSNSLHIITNLSNDARIHLANQKQKKSLNQSTKLSNTHLSLTKKTPKSMIYNQTQRHRNPIRIKPSCITYRRTIDLQLSNYLRPDIIFEADQQHQRGCSLCL